MNQQNNCADDEPTRLLPDLPLPKDQADETKGGPGFEFYGGFLGGVRVAAG